MEAIHGLVFAELDVSNRTLEDAHLAQRKVYLLQEFGVYLGYDFIWWPKGPASRELAEDLDEPFDGILTIAAFAHISLIESVIEQITRVQLLADAAPKSLSENEWYDLLASVMYWHKNNGLTGKDLTKVVREYFPQRRSDTVGKAALALGIEKQT